MPGIADYASITTWAGVLNKPDAFPPVPHRHSVSDLRRDGGSNRTVLRWRDKAGQWVPERLPRGNQGYTGLMGFQGNQGAQGGVGAQGPTGNQGGVGAQGPSGGQGSGGPSGNNGPQGPQGAQGPAGNAGGAGAQGSTGAGGPVGFPGLHGAAGAQGSVGASGAKGTKGASGAQGAEGFPGNEGADGPEGPEGEEGPEGPPCDRNEYCDGWLEGYINGFFDSAAFNQGRLDGYAANCNVCNEPPCIAEPCDHPQPAGCQG